MRMFYDKTFVDLSLLYFPPKQVTTSRNSRRSLVSAWGTPFHSTPRHPLSFGEEPLRPRLHVQQLEAKVGGGGRDPEATGFGNRGSEQQADRVFLGPLSWGTTGSRRLVPTMQWQAREYEGRIFQFLTLPIEVRDFHRALRPNVWEHF